MKDVKIRISADSSQAQANVKSLAKDVRGVKEEAQSTETSVEGVGVAAGKSRKGFTIMRNSVRSVGMAMKTAGIGLLIAVVAGLTEAFSRNKETMDKVSIVMGTIQEVFSQVATAIRNTFNALTATGNTFAALGKVVKGVITLALTPFKFVFYELVLAAKAVKLGIEKAFGDTKSVRKARKEFKKAAKDLKQVAIDAGIAAKDIANNAGEAMEKIVMIGTIVHKEFSKVSIKTAKETAKAYKAATDASAIAEAQAGRLIARFDRQAEQQRQIRDNANASIKERQEANRKLNDILDEQEKQLLRQADAVIAGANAELKKNDSIENQAALISALAGKEQVLADIEGKRSEQIANTNTLLLEQKGLTTSVTNAERDRAKAKRDFEVEQELDPMAKVEKQRTALKLENQAILEDLESKRLLYKEGTQQRIDAEQDYLNKKQVLTQSVIKLDRAEADAKEATLKAIGGGITALGQLAGENASLQKATGVSTAIIDTYVGANKAFGQGGTAGFVTGAAIIASGLANVKTILSTKIPNESDSSQSIPQGGAGAPSFNLIEGTGLNSLENTVSGAGGKPVKAFVTSGDITTAQQADRQAELNSGF